MLTEFKKQHFILILTDPPIIIAMHQLQAHDKILQTLMVYYEYFYTKELMYNPMKHVLVPKHEKISEEDTKNI
jgi:hypothetical protein